MSVVQTGMRGAGLEPNRSAALVRLAAGQTDSDGLGRKRWSFLG